MLGNGWMGASIGGGVVTGGGVVGVVLLAGGVVLPLPGSGVVEVYAGEVLVITGARPNPPSSATVFFE